MIKKLAVIPIAIGALACAFAVIQATAAGAEEQNSAGDWSWYQNAAHTETANGIEVTVWFSEEDLCETSSLVDSGNPDIRYIELDVDGFRSDRASSAPLQSAVWVTLSPDAVDVLKRGYNARLITNVGTAALSLSGSAKAINAAYDTCVRRTRPIVANAPAPASSQQFTLGRADYFAEEVRANGDLIFATGDASGGGIVVLNSIQPGDDVLIERLVTDMESAGFTFNSVLFTYNRGGSLDTAMRIGEFIRRMGAITAVGGLVMEGHGDPYCASACVFAFAGGVQRGINVPARIGMHQASLTDESPGTMEDGQTALVEAYEYLSRMGVDPAIVIEGSKRAPDEMWWLSEYEAKGYGLATMVAKPHE